MSDENKTIGYNGLILKVDLNRGVCESIELDPLIMRKFMGGEGFVAHTLLKEVPKGADPLGEENVLVFSLGIFTGVVMGGSGRHSVGAKSPLTGGFGEAEAGGYWGPELKRAGFDAIVIKGKAKSPVYLSIIDGQAEIKKADRLWGKDTAEVELSIQEEMGDKRVRVAQIGVAGEKLSKIACVIFDRNRAAGRTGLGAVMGSKNLKAVAVRGKGKLQYFDAEKIKETAKWLSDSVNNEGFLSGLKDHGTAGATLYQHNTNTLPTYNFKYGQFDGATAIDGTTMTETILTKRDSCFACPVHCKRVVAVKNDRFEVDPTYGGPEFETIGAFGSMCGIDDLEAIAKANEMCNMFGFDTISAGVTIAFAMECFENGLITKEDTNGIELKYGNADGMLETLKAMVYRTGFGDVLADGAYRAAETLGEETMQYVMHVKKQELPEQEPRGMHGLGLGYALSPTGADHMHNMYDMGYASADSPSLKAMQSFGIYEPVSPYDLSVKKVNIYKYRINWRHMQNCIGVCMFMPYSHDQTREIINAITGWKTSIFDLQLVGERTITLARLFNLREGLSADDDKLPKRLEEELTSQQMNHPGIQQEDLKEALGIYYQMMGWDQKTGVPTETKLVELGLDNYI